MKQEAIRHAMIDGTIHVIARDGLENATTKLLAKESGVNEAYIYRFFDGKDDMLVKTFENLDEELLNSIQSNIIYMKVQNMEMRERCWLTFCGVWKFLIGNKEKCLTFIRYYYSPYFDRYSAESHKKRYEGLVKIMSRAFNEDAYVWMILNHILNVMLDFAVKVFNGTMENTDDNVEHVFRVVYESVKQYFRTEGEQ